MIETYAIEKLDHPIRQHLIIASTHPTFTFTVFARPQFAKVYGRDDMEALAHAPEYFEIIYEWVRSLSSEISEYRFMEIRKR